MQYCLIYAKLIALSSYFQKKAKDHFGIEGDEGSTMVEDNVSAAK